VLGDQSGELGGHGVRAHGVQFAAFPE
jgi:hypothetical protein